MKKFLPCLLGVPLAPSAPSALAEDATVIVGVVVSATGPAASLGIAERNTVALLPRQIGSTKVNYTILDDATDATQAVRNMRKLISENNADLIIGTTATPGSLAMIDVAAEKKDVVVLEPLAERGHPLGKLVLRLLAGAGIPEHGKLEGARLIWQWRGRCARLGEGQQNQQSARV